MATSPVTPKQDEEYTYEDPEYTYESSQAQSAQPSGDVGYFPSAARKFLGELLIKQPAGMLRGLKDLVVGPTSPEQAGPQDILGPAGRLGRAFYESHKKAIELSRKSAEEGQAGKSLFQSIAAGVPGAAQAATIYERSETEPAEAAGEGAFAVLMQALGLKTTKPIVKGGAAEGVPLLASEQSGSKLASFLEGVTEKTITGAGPFSRFRKEQAAAAVSRADKIVEDISAFKGSSEELGRVIQGQREATLVARKKAASEMYGEIDDAVKTHTVRKATTVETPSSLVDEFGNAMTFDKRILKKVEEGGVMVPTKGLKEAILPIARRLQDQRKLMDPKLLADAESIVNQVLHSPPRVSFRTMADTRSDLLAIARRFDEPLAGKRAGITKTLASAADDAMMSAAAESKVPGLATKVREANAHYHETARLFDQRLIEQIGKTQSPEKIAGFVRGAGLQELRDLQQVVPPGAFKAAGARIMRDVLDNVTEGELSRIELIPEGQAGRGVGLEFSPHQTIKGNKFQAELEKIGQPKLEALYGEKIASDLNRLAEVTKRIGKPNPTAAWIAGASNALITYGGFTGRLPEALTTAAAFNVLGRILARPGGAQALTGYLSNAGKPVAAAYWGSKLAVIAEEELKTEQPTE